MENKDDDLDPEKLGTRKNRVRIYQELSSTMDTARELAARGCEAGTVVVALRQNAGRGRMTRTWVSRPGGLYFTMVLRPRIPADQAWKVLFCAGASLCTTIRDICSVPARVKWPNDILASGRKLSGMLTEMVTDGAGIKNLNLGIGLNVNNDPGDPGAAGLAGLCGREFSRGEILTAFLDDFEPRIARLDREPVLERWLPLCETIGRQVNITTLRGSFAGKAVGLAGDGSLIVEAEDGSIVNVACGDCFHRAAADAAAPGENT